MTERTIEFVDPDGGVQALPAAAVPPEIAAVDGVPVARVVARMRGDEREIQSFAADGRLLATTLQRRPR